MPSDSATPYDEVDTTVRLRPATPADADSVARIRGVGPITVDPTVQTRGVGRQLMRAVIDCGADGAGVRLLQDAFNTRSMGSTPTSASSPGSPSRS